MFEKEKTIFSLVVWENKKGEVQCKAESRIEGGDTAIMVVSYMAKNIQNITNTYLKDIAKEKDSGFKAFDSVEDMDGAGK